MNKMISKLTAVLAFALITGAASTSFAAKVAGKVTFVGTMTEVSQNGSYSARFRIRVAASTCDGGQVRERWFHVTSGRMEDIFAHNLANTRNAYGTVMAAFLSSKTIEIENSAINCSSTSVQSIDLWNSNIGIY